MNNITKFNIIKTIVIFVLSFTLFSCVDNLDNNDKKEAMDHSSMDHSSMDHSSMDHGVVETSYHNMDVKIYVSKDEMSGVNIKLETTNFTFAPENVNKENVDGEGHAHLYIDGVKWGRLYGNYVHVGNITEGKHEFKVTLNANNHDYYTHHNESIGDSVTYTY